MVAPGDLGRLTLTTGEVQDAGRAARAADKSQVVGGRRRSAGRREERRRREREHMDDASLPEHRRRVGLLGSWTR